MAFSNGECTETNILRLEFVSRKTLFSGGHFSFSAFASVRIQLPNADTCILTRGNKTGIVFEPVDATNVVLMTMEKELGRAFSGVELKYLDVA